MAQRGIARRWSIALLGVTFLAGFLCGALSQRRAEAQLGEVMKKAGESGALGSVGELGSAIVDMQDHVSALQKNLDTLRKVKSALGG
jgi:hypothetical protein